jgi:ABC-type glycerol-3-phosphate transport system permease component
MWTDLVSYGVLSAYCFLALFPIAWAFLNSLKTRVQMTDYAFAFRFTPTIESYRTLFQIQDFLRLMLNSLAVTLGTTLVTVPIAFSAAFALVRWPFRGERELAIGILATRMLPPVALILPIYTLFRHLDLLNTRVGLTIAYIPFTLPFTIWILRGYLQNIPRDYEECAQIDGLSLFGSIFRIVLPLGAPGVITAALFCGLSAWSEFLFALVLTHDKQAQTATVGVAGLISALGIEWGQLLAASALLMLPMILFVVFAQRYLVEGLTMGLK